MNDEEIVGGVEALKRLSVLALLSVPLLMSSFAAAKWYLNPGFEKQETRLGGLRSRLLVCIGHIGFFIGLEWFFNSFASVAVHFCAIGLWVPLCLLFPFSRRPGGTTESYEVLRLVAGTAFLSCLGIAATLLLFDPEQSLPWSGMVAAMELEFSELKQLSIFGQEFELDIGILKVCTLEVVFALFAMLLAHRRLKAELISRDRKRLVFYGSPSIRVGTRAFLFSCLAIVFVYAGTIYRGEQFEIGHFGAGCGIGIVLSLFVGRTGKRFATKAFEATAAEPAETLRLEQRQELEHPQAQVAFAGRIVPLKEAVSTIEHGSVLINDTNRGRILADVVQLNQLFRDVESKIQNLLSGKLGPSRLMSELLSLIELANAAIVIFEHYTPANGGMSEQFLATMNSSGFKANNDVGRVALPEKLHNASGEVLELWLTEQSECIEVFELIRLIPFSARARLERQIGKQESGSESSGLIVPDPVVAKPVYESEHRSQQQPGIGGRTDGPIETGDGKQHNAPQLDRYNFELDGTEYFLMFNHGEVKQAGRYNLGIQSKYGRLINFYCTAENDFNVGEAVQWVIVTPVGEEYGQVMAVGNERDFCLDLRFLGKWCSESEEGLRRARGIRNREERRFFLRNMQGEGPYFYWITEPKKWAFRLLFEVNAAMALLAGFSENEASGIAHKTAEVMVSYLITERCLQRGGLGFTTKFKAPEKWCYPPSTKLKRSIGSESQLH